MGVVLTVRSARKISGGSWKYRKGVDHRKEVALEEGCKSFEYGSILVKN